MQAITIGTFQKEHIGPFGQLGLVQQGIVESANIPRKEQAPTLHIQLQEGSAQDVAGIAVPVANLLAQRNPLPRLLRTEQGQGFLHILQAIEGFGGAVFGIALLIGPASFFFLQLGAVFQNDAGYLQAGLGAVNGAAKPLGHQAGQVATMVQVAMGEQHRIDGGRIDRKRRPVDQAQLLEPLKQAAVNKDALAQGFDQVFGAGNRFGRSQKMDAYGHGGIGQWTMDDGRWTMDNGQWTIGNGPGGVPQWTGRFTAMDEKPGYPYPFVGVFTNKSCAGQERCW
ncbi:hypothetical protein ADICEAN_00715 [Cesiribacter andamanensis AMV16]|uniref:Uncharacterized protein n=1 Tax=Cesiribacter andamanensis AMV16 TaxID=1279009 RepID=M7N9Z8_9BACT|nr:hypothetical protein ADICEAN_00715 [Cesiribacter andamanensis AMV16]